MSSLNQQRIMVLMGGASAERVISLASGQAVYAALSSQNLNVIALDLSENTADWMNQIHACQADVAFIALHGTYGEDGCIQAILETMNIPYTGANVTASALCMHKKFTKMILQASGITVPQDVLFCDGLPQVFPVFVKPVAEGSSVGLHYIEDQTAWLALGIQDLQGWLVESVVQGVEIAVSVLQGKALPPVEVAPKSGVYDYEAKYTLGATNYYCPARLPAQTRTQCMLLAEQAVQALGCSGAPRVDLIVPESGEPVVLEVNTIPGMTSTSLLPKAAAEVGIHFEDLCALLVRDALAGDALFGGQT